MYHDTFHIVGQECENKFCSASLRLSGREGTMVHKYIMMPFVVIISNFSGLTPFRMWNIETGAMLGRLDQNYSWVWSLKFTSDTMVTGSTVRSLQS